MATCDKTSTWPVPTPRWVGISLALTVLVGFPPGRWLWRAACRWTWPGRGWRWAAPRWPRGLALLLSLVALATLLRDNPMAPVELNDALAHLPRWSLVAPVTMAVGLCPLPHSLPQAPQPP